MKIGPLDSKPQAAPVNGERKATEAVPGKSAEPSSHVALSSTAALLSADGSDGSFDAEKVARISQSIRDGTFKVNPEAIADKLIANAQELLGKVAR